MYIHNTLKLSVALWIPLVFLVSCGGGGGSGILGIGAGQVTTNSASVYAIHGTVPAGSCPNNGVTVDTGIDTNGNAVLDIFEITGSQYLCSWTTGNNGLNGIAAFITEPTGVHCNAGGNMASFGLDANQNNFLDSTEVASFTYICNGTNGVAGAAGANGASGSVWRDGGGVPASSLGVDGDYYFNVTTGDIYLKVFGTYVLTANFMGATGATGASGANGTNGATGSTGATGATGAAGATGATGAVGSNGTAGINGTNGLNGATGVAGSVWYNGTGAPLNTLGVDGDYYLDVTTSDVYLKALGTFSFVTNIKGIAGPTGATGATGAAGTNGTNGTNGATGATGSTGATGANGTAGINGTNGQNGVAGSVWFNGTGVPLNTLGVDGDYYLDVSTSNVYLKALGSYSYITNIKGATGATGAAGATGGGLAEYAYIYNLTAQTVAVEATVLFDSFGVMTTGISHTAGTASIALANPGIYEIGFSISGAEPNQFALFVNGVVVPGSIFGSGAGTQQTHGQVMLAISANSIITLVNHSSAAAVTLASVIGGTAANVNASIMIRKLN